MGINKKPGWNEFFKKLEQTKRHLLKKNQPQKLFLDQAFRGVGWSNDDLRRKQLGKVEDCGRFGEGLWL